MKTAKISSVMRTYALECPHCGADVANDANGGSLDFRDNESNGQTGTCTNCGREVKLPAAVRSNEPKS